MITKILFLLILVSCGERKVKFPDAPAPESNTIVTRGSIMTMQGTFVKQSTINGSTVTVNGSTYPLSEYSSHDALSYYASKPVGSSTQVRLKGEISKGKMLVSQIEDL